MCPYNVSVAAAAAASDFLRCCHTRYKGMLSRSTIRRAVSDPGPDTGYGIDILVERHKTGIISNKKPPCFEGFWPKISGEHFSPLYTCVLSVTVSVDCY